MASALALSNVENALRWAQANKDQQYRDRIDLALRLDERERLMTDQNMRNQIALSTLSLQYQQYRDAVEADKQIATGAKQFLGEHFPKEVSMLKGVNSGDAAKALINWRLQIMDDERQRWGISVQSRALDQDMRFKMIDALLAMNEQLDLTGPYTDIAADYDSPLSAVSESFINGGGDYSQAVRAFNLRRANRALHPGLPDESIKLPFFMPMMSPPPPSMDFDGNILPSYKDDFDRWESELLPRISSFEAMSTYLTRQVYDPATGKAVSVPPEPEDVYDAMRYGRRLIDNWSKVVTNKMLSADELLQQARKLKANTPSATRFSVDVLRDFATNYTLEERKRARALGQPIPTEAELAPFLPLQQ